MQVYLLADSYPAFVQETVAIPPEILVEVATEEPEEVQDIYKFLAIANIILWILYFIGAFDD